MFIWKNYTACLFEGTRLHEPCMWKKYMTYSFERTIQHVYLQNVIDCTKYFMFFTDYTKGTMCVKDRM